MITLRTIPRYLLWANFAAAALGATLTSTAAGQIGQFDQVPVKEQEEAYIFTPPGYAKEGLVRTADPETAAKLSVVVRDAKTRAPTPCRVNVVGPDGNYYLAPPEHLAPYSMTGEWPDKGFGNRRGKAPIRYFGHFFYSTGTFTLSVPPGTCRIEVWKGFEYRPVVVTTSVSPSESRPIEIELTRTVPMAERGYFSGDSHLHLARSSAADEETIFDLLEAEDVRFGSVLCYNLDTSSYTGVMDRQDYPQRRGLGAESLRQRGNYHIISGQEYRSGVYGHLKLFGRPSMVLADDTIDPNQWPVFGELARQTIDQRGYAFYAHGGYAQEIYADLVLGNVQGVELLQFGIYRGIGLDGWYRILNLGYRFPAEGASDYPPCRKFADCRTYVQVEGDPTFAKWYDGLAAGRSFMTTGPLLDLKVNGTRPGNILSSDSADPMEVVIEADAVSEVCPISRLEIIANGKVIRDLTATPPAEGVQRLRLQATLSFDEPTWIAARAYSTTASGSPDGEAHTNPVYLYRKGHRPFDTSSLEWLRSKIEEQRDAHQKRQFTGSDKVVGYFNQALERLNELQRDSGMASE